ncbi:hypothetical protein DFP72DRAFT_1165877 [Ephemerocybe angulata]|uniref:Uncharacterized protein n=1 Tax=Ephemerocybe angulata TaxID=980116 RepID=A0A8H6I866_9AGAR|nr:hypothetical protein DFP72DRAFT_1165877 [Tulosesus angulatus]
MSSTNHISYFFAEYPDFNYDPTETAHSEFRRLCRSMGWERDDPEKVEAYADFQDAIVMQFNERFGTDADKLEPWQKLCRRLGIEPVPDNLKEAREAVFNTHVNLVDLTEANSNSQHKLVIFDTERELARYSKRTGRYMPSESPLVGGVLRALLRFLFNPPKEDLKRDQFGRYVRRGGKTEE